MHNRRRDGLAIRLAIRPTDILASDVTKAEALSLFAVIIGRLLSFFCEAP